MRFKKALILLFPAGLLQGCVAAIGLAGLAAGAAGLTQIVNLARDQFPDIDFNQQAPVEVTYSGGMSSVWNAVIDTLLQEGEQIEFSDKDSGIIRTAESTLNDSNWIEKGLAFSSFKYRYNIVVRSNSRGVGVAVNLAFVEEKVFFANKQKNLPEATNMMRHIFYDALNKKARPQWAKMPDRPDEAIRYAPASREVKGNTSDYTSNSRRNSSDTYSSPQRTGADTVRQAQQALNAAGFDSGRPDGKAGPRTRNAVRKYQKAKGLPISGELDAATLRALGVQ